MAVLRLQKMFSLKNLFVLSLALNMGLLLKVVQEEDSLSSSLPRRPPPSPPSLLNQTSSSSPADEEDDPHALINLDHGDPTMYEKYWKKVGDEADVTVPGGRFISYFSDVSNLCWFLEPELAGSILRLHQAVGNAVVDGRHIVVGSGSSQLILAALYALSSPNSSRPLGVVSSAPYYSSYPPMADFLKSGLFKWEGDAKKFENPDGGPYVEFVTSPNNPDGSIREPVVNREGGLLVHDLAYYWPQYTAITRPADHDLMLFTASKSTGHAGARIGWALVKSREVAKRMAKFIEINTIGVSKDSQVRAAKILEVVSEGVFGKPRGIEAFFGFAQRNMEERWGRLRAAVGQNDRFTLPEFAKGLCRLRGRPYETRPAFAWLKCEGGEGELDCEGLLRAHNILARAGRHFGVGPRYVRVSMLDRDRSFDLFIKRLSLI